VLDEMREAALVFVLEDRARIDGKAKFRSSLRLPVEADVVAQPVRQRADRNLRIDGDGIVQLRGSDVRRNRRLLRRGNSDGRRERGNQQGQTDAN
jgi:hypothetical protein